MERLGQTFSAFDFHTPTDSGTAGALDGNVAANRVTGIGSVYAPSSQIAPDSTFYLRWADADDAGVDHGIAIDDFSLSISLVPEPSTWLAGALALGAIGFMQRRRLRTLLRRAA
jgi:MYXO-CTERM domain-containing protein